MFIMAIINNKILYVVLKFLVRKFRVCRIRYTTTEGERNKAALILLDNFVVL